MEAVKAYYDGSVFIPVEPVKAKRNQTAIITILEEGKFIDATHVAFPGVSQQDKSEDISADSPNMQIVSIEDAQLEIIRLRRLAVKGSLNGQIRMAEDFDEPLEEMQEYM